MMNKLTDEEGKLLISMARRTLESYITNREKPNFSDIDKPFLRKESGLFVTLHKNGRLRGCIGYIVGMEPLFKSVVDLTIASSTQDPRFPKVVKGELSDIDIEISVLTPPEKISNIDEIIMGEHGVIIKAGNRQGLYLPQVYNETGWSKEEFLSNLCETKAGLDRYAWKKPNVEIFIFSTQIFSEK